MGQTSEVNIALEGASLTLGAACNIMLKGQVYSLTGGLGRICIKSILTWLFPPKSNRIRTWRMVVPEDVSVKPSQKPLADYIKTIS